MLGWLSSIKEGISNLAGDITQGIIDGIKEIFVPDEDYLTEKVEFIREKFSFADSVIGTIDYLKESISSAGQDGPPKISINLSTAKSKYNYGTTAFALDMSWYAPYKPTVDAFLSAVLWIFFVWRVFVHLPGIISGVQGIVPESKTETEKMTTKRNRR